jgi:tricorn protease-like protein
MVTLPLLALLASAAMPVVEEGGASMFRYPDISNDEIVFAYANDLWRVPVEGGIALPLASPEGVEVIPRFSPDGSQVAFMGNYEGNRDLYVVPTRGGMPHRVTHHPGSERLSDWGPDGTLLFSGRNMGGVPRAEMVFSVDAEGGMPEALPMPYGANATVDRSGTWVAYTPNQRDGRTWKRYRGGMASDLWLLNLKTGESRQVTDWEGTDTMPMWHGDQLFYLSDAGPEHRLNLWKYDVATGDTTQVTEFSEYDVKWPSIGPDDGRAARIVFQMGSDLHVYDDATGRHESDRSARRHRQSSSDPGRCFRLHHRMVTLTECKARSGLCAWRSLVASRQKGEPEKSLPHLWFRGTIAQLEPRRQVDRLLQRRAWRVRTLRSPQ